MNYGVKEFFVVVEQNKGLIRKRKELAYFDNYEAAESFAKQRDENNKRLYSKKKIVAIETRKMWHSW